MQSQVVSMAASRQAKVLGYHGSAFKGYLAFDSAWSDVTDALGVPERANAADDGDERLVHAENHVVDERDSGCWTTHLAAGTRGGRCSW